MTEIVLINVSGRDRPGITAGLSSILARHDVTVLDIDQAVIHNNLSWGMLVDVTGEDSDSGGSSSDALFKELLFKANELDLDIRFTPVTAQEYEAWYARGGQYRYIITILARRLGADHVASIADLISKHDWNIAGIKRVSPRLPLRNSQAENAQGRRLIAVQLTVSRQGGNVDELRDACLSLSSETDADIAIQEDNIWRRNRRLVCFDMDSTLIQGEAIDLMAQAAGVGEEVSAITARAMNGEIDFKESFRQRLALLKGLPESALAAIDEKIEITEGAEELIQHLTQMGYKTAILSGGFTWFAQRLQQRLGIDHVFANELEIKDGKLTGDVVGEIVDESKKASLIKSIAHTEGIRLEQVIAVGDGANDIPMLSLAGLGIAFHAKPAVREQAQTAFGTVGLDGILYLIGMRENELES